MPHSHRCYSWRCFRIFCVVDVYYVSWLLSSQLRVPKPPSDSQKPKSMTRVYVRKTRSPDEVSRAVRVTVARPLPLDVAPPHPFEYSGEWAWPKVRTLRSVWLMFCQSISVIDDWCVIDDSRCVKGPGGPRFDVQGMVLPHSILGCLKDFRTEMQMRGETEVRVTDSWNRTSFQTSSDIFRERKEL